jgi:hypothetical protein
VLGFAESGPKPGNRKQVNRDSAPVEKTHEKADDSMVNLWGSEMRCQGKS